MEINEFIAELKKLNIEVTDEQLLKLEQYYNLVVEWNKKINLTGITEKREFYLKHIYDSITIIKVIDLKTIETLCDVGTGAGFPGMVLKIIYPNLKITLVDSLRKRIDFLNIVIDKLDLKDIEAVHNRVEEFAKNNIEKFDLVTARAVAHINILLEYSIPMVKVRKYFIAMKAKMEEEKKELNNALKVLKCEVKKIKKFNLPYENSCRTLIKIEKEEKTSKRFPRKYSEIKKNRL